MKKTKKIMLAIGVPAFVILLSAVLMFNNLYDSGTRAYKASAVSVGMSTTRLSMVEMNNSFDKMVLKATTNKTLVYVDKLYFDYSPMSANRLRVTQNEETDYVVIDIKNDTGEWAKVWGYVRKEKNIRPDDPLVREVELTYLEINQYWEWRNFTNQENWSVTVKDGYSTVSFSFDLNSGHDGAVYFIDGVYALPEHYYPQVVYWWDMTGANPELLEIRDAYKQQSLALVETTPEDEPLRLEQVEYKKKSNQGVSSLCINTGVKTLSHDFNNGSVQVEETGFLTGLIIVAVVIVVAAVVVACTPKEKSQTYVPEETPSNITDANDPNQRNDDTPPAPTPDQLDDYEKNVPELTPEEKEELEKRKEFSIDNDVPTGQKIVKLKVKNAEGILQDVYDENGEPCYVNRKTYTVGNQTYALINRKTLLLIRWFPSTMELKDIVGNKFTVNVDNKIMNMDGVEPYSPISRDDILKKLGDMGVYTSSINPDRMIYRMDDDSALIKAMNLKTNNIGKGFWETIGSAFKNLFGGGGTSKGFLSNFLDVLIVFAVGVVCILGSVLVYKFFDKFLLAKRSKT